MKSTILASIAIAALAIAALSITAVADEAPVYKFPGWSCTDAAKFIESAKVSPSKPVAIRDLTLARIASGQKPGSFDELKAMVAEEAAKYTFSEDKAGDDRARKNAIMDVSCGIAFNLKYFLHEAWALAKAEMPLTGLATYAARRNLQEQLGLSDKEVYGICIEYAIWKANKKQLGSVAILEIVVDRMIAIAADMDDVSAVKADFQRLNRKLSLHLLADKSAERIVSKLRTALETY